jgi:hypothetical protein
LARKDIHKDGVSTQFSTENQPANPGRKARVFSQLAKEWKERGIEQATPEAVKEAFQYVLALHLLERTTKDKDGKEIPLKELSALQIVGILLSRETDDNTKLKAFSLIQATLGEAPATKNEVSGPDGTPLFGISKAKQEDIDKLLDLMDGK